MPTRWLWRLAPVLLLALAASCGGSSSSNESSLGIEKYIVNVTAGTTVGTLKTGSPPAKTVGGPVIKASGNTAVVPGGSNQVTVTSDIDMSTIYVTVNGAGGYYEVPVSGTAASLLLTYGRSLPVTFIEGFAAAAPGGVGSRVSMTATRASVGTGELQVSVSWDTNADLDLHLVEPGGEEIYWGNTSSAAGGKLDLDSNTACNLDSIRNENITYAKKPPSGTYTVRVDNWENCVHEAVHFVVTVGRPGADPVTQTGSFAADDLGDNGGAGSGVTVLTFTYP